MKHIPAIAIAVVGCATMAPPPPKARFDAANPRSDLPATSASEIRVLTPDKLPDGFTLDRMTLYAVPGMPSSDDPHVILGEVRVDVNTRHHRAAYIPAMEEEAAT